MIKIKAENKEKEIYVAIINKIWYKKIWYYFIKQIYSNINV
jgi:hypothetical protein